MANIEYSPQALEDLLLLREYISTEWGEKVAEKILSKIIKDIRRLEQFPLSGINLGKIIDVPTDYRFLFSEKNYIFYHLEFDKVRIVRVLNEKQDYMQQVFGISLESDEDY